MAVDFFFIVLINKFFYFTEIRGLDGDENEDIGDLVDLYPEMFTETRHKDSSVGVGDGGNGIGDNRNRTKHGHHSDGSQQPVPVSPNASVRLTPPFYGTFKYL